MGLGPPASAPTSLNHSRYVGGGHPQVPEPLSRPRLPLPWSDKGAHRLLLPPSSSSSKTAENPSASLYVSCYFPCHPGSLAVYFPLLEPFDFSENTSQMSGDAVSSDCRGTALLRAR